MKLKKEDWKKTEMERLNKAFGENMEVNIRGWLVIKRTWMWHDINHKKIVAACLLDQESKERQEGPEAI